MNTAARTWRSVTFGILEGPQCYPASRLVGRFIVALIVANGIAVVLESNPAIHLRYLELFTAFEVFSVVVFSAEYLARLWAAAEHPHYAGKGPLQARLRYMLRPMALVDLLAILPFYLSLFVHIDLRYLRLFRLMRLLKLSHHFDGLSIFATVLRREASSIAGALMIMLVVTVVSACLMFTVENQAAPGHFHSVADSIWWAVVTLTTVGYGDITPVTFAGKLLGIVIMVLGVGTMALPAGILAARFTEELQFRRELLAEKVRQALEDGVLDADEERSLEAMQERLGISRQQLERLIRLKQQQLRQYSYCPHCGSSLRSPAAAARD
ncbi:MAG: ion transporter [Gammaproteobacteria bacterium]|nr:MAG: ion transporter [Gammaproteobacteria bacterium]